MRATLVESIDELKAKRFFLVGSDYDLLNSAADIIGFCRDMLAHYKAPKTVVFGPLPKTSTGKIQKFVLRERARGLEP